MVFVFERYTEAAREVIFFARQEAVQYGSSRIETEHLLLALIREDSETRKILGGSSAALVRERVEAAPPPPHQALPTWPDLPLSQASKRALAYAAEEAERLGDPMIRAPHLLLGLLRERQGVATRILADLKVSLDEARRVVAGAEAVDISELHTTASVWAGSMAQPLAAHHVLLALLNDPESPAAQFLREHGITESSICERFGGTPR
jgi:ATP-dependent Clp protease ATP-binding subunit ClpC